jgi:DNA-binding MarR family transcriptional regulator
MSGTVRDITKIGRTVRRYADQAISNYGISYAEYECLHFVRHHPGTNQENLCEWLNIDKAAIARMVANLEEKGYLRREHGERDRRTKLLYVTEKDNDIKKTTEDAEIRFYNWLIADLDPEELGIFFKVLHQIYEKSKDAGKRGFQNIEG